MIAIIDYGMGNLHSVSKAFEAAGGNVRVTKDARDIVAAKRIVLPGQGAFRDCMDQLRASGLVDILDEQVRREGKPFFGICLGLQLLATVSDEDGSHAGLDWYPAGVERLRPTDPACRVPHIGWNDVFFEVDTPLAKGFKRQSIFYFDHSYHFVAVEASLVAARSDHGGPFVAAIQRDNVFATQFHPEKSQATGLRLIENFLQWAP